MKLIIDIPEEDYEYIKNSDDMNFNVIKNGIPLEFGNISVEAIEESSHCPACIHYVQRDVPSVFCNNCKNRDELYRRIKNEKRRSNRTV